MTGIDDDVSEHGEAHVDLVARRLASLPERGMRCARLREIVLALSPDRAAWLLDSLASAGRAGGPPYDLSLIAAVDLVSNEALREEERRALYEAADAQNLTACKELLSSDEDLYDGRASAPRSLLPGTRPLTLGERKALARSWNRDVLERLILDPHADVVELLLENPHVTENDIVKLATSRHSHAAVLSLVLRSRRWGSNRRVRKALVRNPNLPVATALRLLGLLNRVDLRELSRDPGIPLSMQVALDRRLRPPD